MRLDQIHVEVEPMSDARWARVERELFARVDAELLPRVPAPALAPPPSPWAARAFTWAATGVIVAAAVFIAFLLRNPAPREEVRLATNDGTSQFTVGESWLTVAPKSLVMVRGDDEHGVDVVLDRGKVTCEVAPRRGRPAFRLDSGDVRVKVIGTKFTVQHEEGSTSVFVEHGVVEVTARGVVVDLHDGESWPAHLHTTAKIAAPTTTPTTIASVAPIPSVSPGKGLHRRHGADVDPTDQVVPEPPIADEGAAEAETVPEVVPSSQEAFEAAARMERTNPEQAAAEYRQISSSHSAWAQIALFAWARLESDRGHRGEAARLFNLYLTRYPHGLNADDARELLRRMR